MWNFPGIGSGNFTIPYCFAFKPEIDVIDWFWKLQSIFLDLDWSTKIFAEVLQSRLIISLSRSGEFFVLLETLWVCLWTLVYYDFGSYCALYVCLRRGSSIWQELLSSVWLNSFPLPWRVGIFQFLCPTRRLCVCLICCVEPIISEWGVCTFVVSQNCGAWDYPLSLLLPV